MRKTSIRDVYSASVFIHIFLLLVYIACCISFPFIIKSDNRVLDTVLLIIIEVAFAVLTIYCIVRLITLFKDYSANKNENYITITAKVKCFKKNRDTETGAQINNFPILIIVDTNEEICLHVLETIEIGGTYVFNYLKNSKIAEVVEQVSDNNPLDGENAD